MVSLPIALESPNTSDPTIVQPAPNTTTAQPASRDDDMRKAAFYAAKAWQLLTKADENYAAKKHKEISEEIYGADVFGEALRQAIAEAE